MSQMPWIKLYTEILDDVKLARLTDAQKWRFVQLVLLAGECDAGGDLVTGDSPMTHEDVSWRLRCDIETLTTDIKELVKIGLITNTHDVISVVQFSERQGPTQEEKRRQWRERQQKRRDRVKKKEIVTRESPVTPAGVTPLEEEEELDKINGDKPPSQKVQDETRKELEIYFLSQTGLPVPKTGTQKQKKAAGAMWYAPLREIAELGEWDIESSKTIINGSLDRLKDVTVSNPNSILKTARAVYAENNKPKDEQYAEVHG